MLRNEIVPYTDGNKLVAPNLTNGAVRGSDNGIMFTSEYFIMLRYRKEEQPRDGSDYRGRMLSCTAPAGVLHRAPGAPGQDAPDDFYGYLAGCKVFGFQDLATDIVEHGLKHFGFFNTPNPDGYRYPATYEDPNRAGKLNWQATIWRQPQLIAASYAASGRSRWWHFPFFAYAAGAMVGSSYWSSSGDADAFRLNWLLIQTVSETSFVCYLAQKFWFRKLLQRFPKGMCGVAELYYQDQHPFKKYWVDRPPGGFKLPVASMLQWLGSASVIGSGIFYAIWRHHHG